ncbi:hypothetical protein A415_1812 [Listeria monocytogenes serotype 1/2a str. 10-0933]|nr:hypothetical protein A411_1846 [Listeria monocytogenes serotype 1/2a str. 10-0812]ASH44541.1 hypothetical protein A412_1844 [Listeria monocytogenes serotype 1/2a str. 10-0813]ASH61852.1 hypothetical protein A415_1812 [Listeria monocytogenes serotype 1/2a str. 10-0933]ASH64648.1 hypothetical protein A416_1813 [Listeria monocytogenes serotype 1/2a str. 10-0934]
MRQFGIADNKEGRTCFGKFTDFRLLLTLVNLNISYFC